MPGRCDRAQHVTKQLDSLKALTHTSGSGTRGAESRNNRLRLNPQTQHLLRLLSKVRERVRGLFSELKNISQKRARLTNRPQQSVKRKLCLLRKVVKTYTNLTDLLNQNSHTGNTGQPAQRANKPAD